MKGFLQSRYKAKKATIVLLIIFIGAITPACEPNNILEHFYPKPPSISGEQARTWVAEQTQFGPRIPDTAAHEKFISWVVGKLHKWDWKVEVQHSMKNKLPIQNIIAKRGNGKPWIIIGAHYDSRPIADHDSDPQKRQLPVPGANDSGSGVAVLLELARTLPKFSQGECWLVFFDAEDSGGFAGNEWSMGSSAFVEQLSTAPTAVVIIDMIGDENLTIYQELNSDEILTQEIWAVAASLGYEKAFPSQKKYRIIDDHLPFIKNNIPAALLIDFDYPYWHTTEDTLDKVSAESLKIVGDVVSTWIKQKLGEKQLP